MRVIKYMIKILILLIILGISAFIYARYIEPNLLTVKKFTQKVPKSVSECKIVLFTDTHFGKIYKENKIEKIVQKINEQSPDIVVFGGDFFDNYARDAATLDLEYLAEQMNQISAKYGKYAVFGNHDYGGGAVRVYEEFMRSSGFTVLKNSSVLLEELDIEIIGYDDYLWGFLDPELYHLDKDQYHLVVTHEPDAAQNIVAEGSNLILSGHSHGGQVSIPYLTKKILPRGALMYVKGMYRYPELPINKDTSLYVSKGIGMSIMPYRFMNVPEIVVINLIN